VVNELAEGLCTLAVHAPTSGVIASIGTSFVADHNEQQQLCIELTTDGHDEALPLTPIENYSQLSATEIITLIADAGIIGMGGAGFPTADKLRSCANSTMEFLIINAAECEPYISADEALIRERAHKVVLGAEILRSASKARRCIIAIEDSKPDAIAALKQVLQSEANSEPPCELVVIPGKYPAGSERQLIQCVTGIELAAAQLPTEHGIVVQNIGTAYATFEAVAEGKPCVSRITTLCGQALQTPKNFETLIGTSASYLFELCGIEASKRQRSILGGSLMGHELQSDRAAICKTSNCLIAMSAEEQQQAKIEQACIRCGLCADACPARLLPQQLLTLSKNSDSKALLEHGLFDCIECGACDYVCPSHIPLVGTYKKSKNALRSRRQTIERSQYWQQRFQFRQYRLKKEKDEAASRKPSTIAQPEQKTVQASKLENDKQEYISKEQASKDIAAAVARVKARREEKNK